MPRQPSTPPATVPCQQCGRTFQTFACYIRKGNGKYCGRACYWEAKRRRIEQTCLVCGAAFQTTQSRVDRGWGCYCSDPCMRVGRITRETRTCQHCGKTFEVNLYRTRTGKDKHCSRECKDESQRGVERSTLAEKFWAKVQKTDSCWLWTGSKNETGYGIIGTGPRGPKFQFAHRLSWELHNGPIPEGMCVCHNCPGGDQPACCNPAHLFLGTRADNMADMARKGGNARNRKLTDDSAREIREKNIAGVSQKKLASAYGVSLQTIRNVIHRKVYKHVP